MATKDPVTRSYQGSECVLKPVASVFGIFWKFQSLRPPPGVTASQV